MDYARPEYFNRKISDEERAKLIDTFGTIPEDEFFEIDIQKILGWGRPWWRIFEIVYGRNAKKDNLTDEDDMLTWKALLFTLAEKLNRYHLPTRLMHITGRKQWRRDMFYDSATYMWKIIKDARGKNLSVHSTVWVAITRAARGCDGSKPFHAPDSFDMERFEECHKSWVRDASDEAAHNLDQDEDEELLRDRVRDRLYWRISEKLNPGVPELMLHATRNGSKIREPKWLLDLIDVHTRLVGHALKIQRKDWRTERGF